eukprot:570075-Rhodomonas_salina.1
MDSYRILGFLQNPKVPWYPTESSATRVARASHASYGTRVPKSYRILQNPTRRQPGRIPTRR